MQVKNVNSQKFMKLAQTSEQLPQTSENKVSVDSTEVDTVDAVTGTGEDPALVNSTESAPESVTQETSNATDSPDSEDTPEDQQREEVLALLDELTQDELRNSFVREYTIEQFEEFITSKSESDVFSTRYNKSVELDVTLGLSLENSDGVWVAKTHEEMMAFVTPLGFKPCYLSRSVLGVQSVFSLSVSHDGLIFAKLIG